MSAQPRVGIGKSQRRDRRSNKVARRDRLMSMLQEIEAQLYTYEDLLAFWVAANNIRARTSLRYHAHELSLWFLRRRRRRDISRILMVLTSLSVRRLSVRLGRQNSLLAGDMGKKVRSVY